MILRAVTTLMGGLAFIAAGETATTFGAPELLTKLVEVLGPVGLAVWYCWYTTTKTLPRKDRDYKELDQKKDLLIATILEKRDKEHTAALTKLSEERRETFADLRSGMDRASEERRESSAEIRKGLDSMAAAVSQLSVQCATMRGKG